MKTLLSTAAMVLFVAAAGTAGAQTMAPASPGAPSPSAPAPAPTPAPSHEERATAAPDQATDAGEAAKPAPEQKHMMHKARWTSEESKERAETQKLNQAELKSDITPAEAPTFSDKSAPPTR